MVKLIRLLFRDRFEEPLQAIPKPHVRFRPLRFAVGGDRLVTRDYFERRL
jgi:hypothetical protein